MADIIDLAGDRIDAEMTARLRVLPVFDIASLTECSQCGDDIPVARQALGNVKMCIDCQDHHDRLVRHWKYGKAKG